jgi:hypothetical protein
MTAGGMMGAWRLVEQIERWPDGVQTFPRGEDAHGLIVYTADGWMSAQLGRAALRAGVDRWSPDFALEDFLAYAGRFEVDSDCQRVQHHVAVSSFPPYRGATLERSVLFPETNQLQLTASRPGGAACRVLLWQRPEETAMTTATALVGAWLLEGYTQAEADGSVTHPMGRDPYGVLQYGADGWMSVIISRRERGPEHTPGSDAFAYHQFVSYYGRYSADIEAGQVVHHTVFATYAPMHAADLPRRLAFVTPDVITLSATNAAGAPITLRWRRAATA